LFEKRRHPEIRRCRGVHQAATFVHSPVDAASRRISKMDGVVFTI
jgi:hypothetical protein